MLISETILKSDLSDGCKTLLSCLAESNSPVSYTNNELAYELKVKSIRTVRRRINRLKKMRLISVRIRNNTRFLSVREEGRKILSGGTPQFPKNLIQKLVEKCERDYNACCKKNSKKNIGSKQRTKKNGEKLSKKSTYNIYYSSSIDLKKLKEDKIKRKRKMTKSSKKRTEIDWLRLDAHGRPIISFSPEPRERDRMIEILNKRSMNPIKKKLLEKLKTKFAWSYVIYRRQLQEIAGRKPSYRLPEDEMKFAERAAVHCIKFGVTPRQVLKYWHENIGNFKNDMVIPPISFLSAATTIETVACSDLKELEKPKVKLSKFGNSFADLDQYDPRVRDTLEKGGYDTKKYSDKYLMSIQFAAKAFALGADLFVEKTIRPMAKYLAKTLYKDIRKGR